jgi:hypothetical protein
MLSDSALDRARSIKLADVELTENFFWKARSALDVLNAVNADPDERARAASLWAELYRAVHALRDETGGERALRIGRIDKLAAVAGLSPILFHLREFSLDLNHAVLTSPNPGKTLDSIIHGPPREGNPGRAFNERIAMAVDVQKKRWLGMTDEKACGEIAEKTRDPHIGRDAVRSIRASSPARRDVQILYRRLSSARLRCGMERAAGLRLR